MRVTTEGILGLELVAIHRGDDWRDTGAGAGGCMSGTSGVRRKEGRRRRSGPHSKI